MDPQVKPMLFICSGCKNMDLASEPVAICHCGQFWCSQRCLGMTFRTHLTETPSLEHRFVDHYPRLCEGEIIKDPKQNCIGGVMFHQYRSAPKVVPVTFAFRRDDNGQIVDCIPQVDGFLPPAQLSYRRVGGRGSDLPFELWYYKNQMQLGVECPDSANDTIASLSGSSELDKLWFGSVIAVMLEKKGRLKTYTNVQYDHMSLFVRFFRSSMSPCMVY
ncbi:hypothetical protein IW261DRAFT_1511028 [Armillaria novae-zelandiae]|uniref:Uncharacterized protein n=1 Tax=Armillaria novae-zelandiae TaxID=153914 RepID=A0AA39NTX7_9AGAR|nr:hypothetical protein IW261DRAFT_1511028 [Armillaria novae-zelandiae]